MNGEAEEGQGFLMPFLQVVVIVEVPCLQTGCNSGLCYFITVRQSDVAGGRDIRCSCEDVANIPVKLVTQKHFFILWDQIHSL